MVTKRQGGDRFVRVNGAKLHYLEWGGDGPVILCLAGLADTAYSFACLAPRFADRFRVLGLTRRGFGQSDAPEGSYDLGQLVDDIRAFLDALDIRQVSMVGHSYAGYEMTRFATLYPERVRRLVYLDTIWEISRKEIEARASDPIYSSWPQRPPPAALRSIDAYLGYIRRIRSDFDRMWSPLIENMVRQNLRVTAGGTIEEPDRSNILDEMVESALAYEPDYTRLRAPILCVYAIPQDHPHLPAGAPEPLREQARRYYLDNIYSHKQESIRKLQAQNNDVEIVELPGADHFCHISNEADVYRHVSNFLGD